MSVMYVMLVICLGWTATRTLAQDTDICAEGAPNIEYGNGSDGDLVIPPGQTWELEPFKNYVNVVVGDNATLDTRGHTLRVCRTLTNRGTISDWYCGGAGGSGGQGGRGGSPCGNWPGKPPECEPGECGTSGSAPVCDGAGRGGDGGCGGSGGGGAWRQFLAYCAEAYGGDGGDGGDGGRGGGSVRIYAHNLDNEGTIHADGERGIGRGDPSVNIDGEDGEYFRWRHGGLLKDLAGGGGGGGAGGAGGDGGTVEIHYCHPLNLNANDIHARGGDGGIGGSGGCGHTCHYATPSGNRQPGCPGTCGGGEGGDGEYRFGRSSGHGGDGANGAHGLDGTRILEWPCCEYDSANFNVLRYDLDIEITPEPENRWIEGHNTMQIRSLIDGAESFRFRLDQKRFATPTVSVNDTGEPPWEEVPWEWAGDGKTACASLNRQYNHGEDFYVKVEYAGAPWSEDGDGMFFETHGPSLVPIVFTTVEPWFAYRWLPVKDDGDNWNCDKATAELSFTVPDWMEVVSNGVCNDVEVLRETSQKKWNWETTHETAAYLFSVAATNYDVTKPYYAATDVALYTWPEDSGPLSDSGWNRVTQMLEFFSHHERFGPYPFADEKYAIYQWPEGSGGMEHQTASGQEGRPWFITFIHHPLFPFEESVTAEEAAHQWWGDLITCATWNNIWLNEGLGNYARVVWFESQDSRPQIPGRTPWMRAHLYMLWYYRAELFRIGGFGEAVYAYDISPPGDIFTVQFSKAPWVLHMLRHLSDPAYTSDGPDNNCDTPVFYKILRKYRDEQMAEDPPPPGCATTEEFREAAEHVLAADNIYDTWKAYPGHPGDDSFDDLVWFFGEPSDNPEERYGWVYGHGAPSYRYSWWNEATGDERVLKLRIRQVQSEEHENDAEVFVMPIDVTLWYGPLQSTRRTVWNCAEHQVISIPVDRPVLWVDFDPDDWVLRRAARPEVYGRISDMGVKAATDGPAAAVNNVTQVAAGLDVEGAGGRASMWLVEPYYGLEPGANDLGFLPGDTSSTAFDLNDAGQTVGESRDGNGAVHAVLWLPERAFGWEPGLHELPSIGPVSSARAINDIGQIAGFSGTPGAHQAVLWEYNYEAGEWEVIPLPPPPPGVGEASEATGISNGAQVVGWWETEADSRHAVLWKYDWENEEWRGIDLGPGEAHDVNDSGEIVGASAATPVRSPIKWILPADVPDPIPVPVPLPIAGSRSCEGVAYGINSAGEIVGQYCGSAVLWLPAPAYGLPEGMSDLNSDPVPAVPCWILEVGLDINDAGQIVGYGHHFGASEKHVFLLDLYGGEDCNGNDIVDDCEPLFLDPPDGVRDARQPHPPDDSTPEVMEGIDTFLVIAPEGAEDISRWSACETNNNPDKHPGIAPPNNIKKVTCEDELCTVTLQRPIAHGEVTTIAYDETETGGCIQGMGTFIFLPGDANGDGCSTPADVLAVIDCCVNKVCDPPWGFYSCDIDRDGWPAQADILRVIDLLNGAGEYEPWLNVCIDATGCP